jgi:hypothetical protein
MFLIEGLFVHTVHAGSLEQVWGQPHMVNEDNGLRFAVGRRVKFL